MSWPSYKLDELGSVSRGRSRHRPRDAEHLYGGPFPFIQTGDVKKAPLYLSDYSQTYSEAGLAQSKLWPAGTLCVTIAANIAETAILDIDACFPDSIIGFVADPEMADTKFIKYQFDALLKKKMRRVSQGAAQDNLSQGKLLTFEFPAPDVDQQKRIAAVLSKYDDLIENNRRRIVLLEEAARLLYREWFVHFRFPGAEHVKIADGVPEGWEQTNVEKITDFLSRGITPKYDEDGESIVINQKCIRNSKLNLELSRKQSKKIPDAKYVKLGDVLINSTGAGTLGRVAQCQIKKNNLTVDSHVTIARPAKGISALWYGLLFFSLESHIETMGRGATNQTELSKNDIAELKLLKPNSSLLSEFEEIVAPMILQVSALGEMNKQLAKARDMLLPRLMDGRLEI